MDEKPKWQWRVNCGPGLIGVELNGERFMVHRLPWVEPFGADEYVMTVQIRLKPDRRHHTLEVVDLDGAPHQIERLIPYQLGTSHHVTFEGSPVSVLHVGGRRFRVIEEVFDGPEVDGGLFFSKPTDA